MLYAERKVGIEEVESEEDDMGDPYAFQYRFGTPEEVLPDDTAECTVC